MQSACWSCVFMHSEHDREAQRFVNNTEHVGIIVGYIRRFFFARGPPVHVEDSSGEASLTLPPTRDLGMAPNGVLSFMEYIVNRQLTKAQGKA